jgi:hypothetical protein
VPLAWITPMVARANPTNGYWDRAAAAVFSYRSGNLPSFARSKRPEQRTMRAERWPGSTGRALVAIAWRIQASRSRFRERVYLRKERTMGLINGLWLAVLGVLGASSLIIARQPDAKELIGKIAPYQGWIGAISALAGVWGVISSVLSLNWLTHSPIYWITFLVNALLLLALGLLLGVGVLKTFISDAQAQARMDQTITRLAPYQGNLGIVAVVLGIWMVISSFLYRIV